MSCIIPICPTSEGLHSIEFAMIKRRGSGVWDMQSTIWDRRVDGSAPFY